MKTLLVSAILAVTAIAVKTESIAIDVEMVHNNPFSFHQVDSTAPIAERKIRMFTTLDPAPAVETDNAELIKCLVDTVDQIAKEEGIEDLWHPTSQKIHEHSKEWSKCPTVEYVLRIFGFPFRFATNIDSNCFSRCQNDIMSRIMDLFNEFLLVVISEQMEVFDRIMQNLREKCYHLDDESGKFGRKKPSLTDDRHVVSIF